MSKTLKRVTTWLAASSAFALAIHVASAHVEASRLFDDPNTFGRARPWWGSLSIAGSMLWAAASTACILGVLVLRRLGHGKTEAVRFLIATGVLAAAAGADDSLLIHEDFMPFHLGIDENFVLAAWGLVIAAWVIRFGSSLLGSETVLLVLAGVSLGASMAIDVGVVDVEGAAEEVLKLVGIATFTAYCWLEVIERISAALELSPSQSSRRTP